jgi:hypothetical protein
VQQSGAHAARDHKHDHTPRVLHHVLPEHDHDIGLDHVDDRGVDGVHPHLGFARAVTGRRRHHHGHSRPSRSSRAAVRR